MVFGLFQKKPAQHMQQPLPLQEKPKEQIYEIHLPPAGKISKDMAIAEVVQHYPEAVEPLMAAGVHCVGCHISPYETLEQGLKGHGMSDASMHAVIEKLNQAVEKKRNAAATITITEAAAEKIQELAKAKNAGGLRIAVTPGGCSGFQYEFELEHNQQPDDIIIEQQGAKVFIQPSTMEMIKGSQLEYLDTLQGAGFKIQNPQAKSTCGCGNSFS